MYVVSFYHKIKGRFYFKITQPLYEIWIFNATLVLPGNKIQIYCAECCVFKKYNLWQKIHWDSSFKHPSNLFSNNTNFQINSSRQKMMEYEQKTLVCTLTLIWFTFLLTGFEVCFDSKSYLYQKVKIYKSYKKMARTYS